eukprot:jgi/Undpi1/9108/HiC_scaffold_26.g11566.m1
MCLHSGTASGATVLPSPSELVPRKSPPIWQVMFWTPLEVLLVATTLAIGFTAMTLPTRLDLPVPGKLATVVQGVLVLLHSLCEGPRLQVLPLYVPALLLAINATEVFGASTAWIVTMGVLTLSLASCSLLLCYKMPRLLPIGTRGPYAVAIATEHIRTVVAGKDATAEPPVEELWPLEVMAQVFYPVEKTCTAKLPWFPSTIKRFRRSLVPAWGDAKRLPFGLTQAGVVGAAIILGSSASLHPNSTPPLEALVSSSFFSLVASARTWAVAAASALCSACVVSDVRVGRSRSAYKARYLGQEQAKSVAKFAHMPGWLTAHLSRFDGPGYEAGHFLAPGVPCFPAAALAPGESKRPLVIFSHGLGGNRGLYSALAAEMASCGYVVVSIEHNDGSSCSTVFPDGRMPPACVAAPNTKHIGAAENRGFRLAQLKRRGREVRLVRAHLAKLARGDESDFEACRRVALGGIIDVKRPAYVGHSFGGATILQVLSDEAKSSGNVEESGYSMAFIMDGWPFPLSEEARHQKIAVPVIFVTTDTFLGKEGQATEDRLVENAVGMVRDGANDLAIQLRVKDAEHNNFSDAALFAPDIMRSLKTAGKMDGTTFMDQVLRLTLCALEVFLRRRTEQGDAVKTPPPSDISSALLGLDLAENFPEAWVRRGGAGGVLPWMEMHE